jgi:hypothetical protein
MILRLAKRRQNESVSLPNSFCRSLPAVFYSRPDVFGGFAFFLRNQNAKPFSCESASFASSIFPGQYYYERKGKKICTADAVH